MERSDKTQDFRNHLKKLQAGLEETLKHPSSLSQEVRQALEEGKESLKHLKALFSEALESKGGKGSSLIEEGKENFLKLFDEGNIESFKKVACEFGKESEKWVKNYPLSFLLSAFLLGVFLGKR